MNKLEGLDHTVPTSLQIIEKVGSELTNEEYLLLSPINKWPVKHAEGFANSDMLKSTKHPYHKLAIYQYESWHKSSKNINTEFSDYYNKPLAKSVDRTKAHFTSETESEYGTFLAEILTFAISLNRYLFSCNKLLQFLAAGDMSKYYQLWVNEILINKGWLFLQSLFQLALITHDFNRLMPELTPPKSGAKKLQAIINKRLTPVYRCKGSELMSYWHPVFLYILYQQHSDQVQNIVPANFQSRNAAISCKSFESFQKNISNTGALSWISKFGQYLGLLD